VPGRWGKERLGNLFSDVLHPVVLAWQALAVDGGTDSGVLQLLGASVMAGWRTITRIRLPFRRDEYRREVFAVGCVETLLDSPSARAAWDPWMTYPRVLLNLAEQILAVDRLECATAYRLEA